MSSYNINLNKLKIDDVVSVDFFDVKGNTVMRLDNNFAYNTQDQYYPRAYELHDCDVIYYSKEIYADICKKVKPGQVLYDRTNIQGIVTKIIYDREKKWWQFWIIRKQTGCYVEWRNL